MKNNNSIDKVSIQCGALPPILIIPISLSEINLTPQSRQWIDIVLTRISSLKLITQDNMNNMFVNKGVLESTLYGM